MAISTTNGDTNMSMETTWLVNEVIEKPGLKSAELHRVEWFKKNPAHDEAMAAYKAVVEVEGAEAAEEPGRFEDELPSEFMDAEPYEEGAEHIESHGKMTLDLTDSDLDLHPLDAVIVTVSVVETVDIDVDA